MAFSRQGLPGDIGAERGELADQIFVSPVEEIDVGNGARLGDEKRRHDVGEAGAQIGDRNVFCLEDGRPFYDEAMVVVARGEAAAFTAEALGEHLDVGAHFL